MDKGSNYFSKMQKNQFVFFEKSGKGMDIFRIMDRLCNNFASRCEKNSFRRIRTPFIESTANAKLRKMFVELTFRN